MKIQEKNKLNPKKVEKYNRSKKKKNANNR